MTSFESWGKYPHPKHKEERFPFWTSDASKLLRENKASLPVGQGRSYGDSCLSEGSTLIRTDHLDRWIHFDQNKGTLKCEAGCTLQEILSFIVPKGWFLPTSPGTQFVTVAGAVANDIHGKNHHRAGTFGSNVLSFELVRSDGTTLVCSPSENETWFRATIGGLGLTGLITWVEFKLSPIQNPFIDGSNTKFETFDEFLELSQESESKFESTVSWIDCFSKKTRGHFTAGNFSKSHPGSDPSTEKSSPKIPFPFTAPNFLLNKLSIKAFNLLYHHRQISKSSSFRCHYKPFFYPLDNILHWNRMYGRRGFFQHQCVIPQRDSNEAMREILKQVSSGRMGSFLVVLKSFGKIPSPGILSFPMEGLTLALDFANDGEETLDFLDRLDAIVHSAGGRIYPAKDARMSAENFKRGYPDWETIEEKRDPRIHSDFWRRVTGC